MWLSGGVVCLGKARSLVTAADCSDRPPPPSSTSLNLRAIAAAGTPPSSSAGRPILVMKSDQSSLRQNERDGTTSGGSGTVRHARRVALDQSVFRLCGAPSEPKKAGLFSTNTHRHVSRVTTSLDFGAVLVSYTSRESYFFMFSETNPGPIGVPAGTGVRCDPGHGGTGTTSQSQKRSHLNSPIHLLHPSAGSKAGGTGW